MTTTQTSTATATTIKGCSDDQIHVTGRYSIYIDAFGTWDQPVTIQFSTGQTATVTFNARQGEGWVVAGAGFAVTEVDQCGTADQVAELADDSSEWAVVTVKGVPSLVLPGGDDWAMLG